MEREGAAAAGFAIHTDVSAHAGGQMLADGNAQSGRAGGRRGGGTARRGNQQRRLLCFRETGTGIDDGYFRGDAIRAARDGAYVKRDRALRRVLDRVADKVMHDLRDTHRVAGDARRKSRINQHLKDETFFQRHGAENALHVFGDVAHAKRRFFEHQLSGFNFREIEHAAHGTHQRMGRRQDFDQIIQRRSRRLFAHGDVGKPDDAVQRRANLMADVGEKRALGARGGFGGLFGAREFFARPLIRRGFRGERGVVRVDARDFPPRLLHAEIVAERQFEGVTEQHAVPARHDEQQRHDGKQGRSDQGRHWPAANPQHQRGRRECEHAKGGVDAPQRRQRGHGRGADAG